MEEPIVSALRLMCFLISRPKKEERRRQKLQQPPKLEERKQHGRADCVRFAIDVFFNWSRPTIDASVNSFLKREEAKREREANDQCVS